VADAFVCVVVEVFEPDLPIFREGFVFDCESVVLGGDVAFFEVGGVWIDVLAWLVLGAVTEF